MAKSAALHMGNAAGRRARVRTPGKYIVLTLFLVASLAGAGAGVWLSTADRRAAMAAVEYRGGAAGLRAAYYPLPEFLVDLQPDLDGRTAYLRLRCSILLGEGAPAEAAAHVDALQPAIVERISFFLRELRPEDFSGSEDMARVKEELLRRVNLVLAPTPARDVVIEDIVIQ